MGARRAEEVTVLGSGVMGAAIAAHLANAGVRVRLLDVLRPEAPAGAPRDAVARAGLEAARRARPPAFFSPRWESLITTGNLEDDLAAAAASSDIIIEAVVEDPAVKRQLFTRLDELGGRAVVASNTSGLRAADLVAGRSEGFRRRFCITHFFNPPRYLRLVELVAGPDTAPETLAAVEELCGRVLGKGLVQAKDTPSFIANRIGTFGLMRTMEAALEGGYTVEEVDAVFGVPMGRPKSAVFRTADVVGLDTLVHVALNCFESLPGDERRDVFRIPPVLSRLVERRALGAKTGRGFYTKTAAGEIQQLDPTTLEYVGLAKPRFASIGAARATDDPAERIRRMVAGDDRAAQLARRMTLEMLAYAAARIGEIADEPVAIDRAMRWGFGWELGPFEIWDALGPARTLAAMKHEGVAVPAWVEERLAGDEDRFYRREPAGRVSQLLLGGGWRDLPDDPHELRLDRVRAAGGEIERSAGASILDLGEGVLCLEYHSKMNAIDADIVAMTEKAVARAEREGVALVIGNDAARAFSAGANLMAMLMAIGMKDFESIDTMLRTFQASNLRLRTARVPVVCAPAGMALGGGAEVVLLSRHVHAAAELYLGCVEAGVGLIPSGGGSTELAARAAERVPPEPRFDMLPVVRPFFELAARARVSTSADEARDLGLLRESTGVSMARETLLHDARELALGLARAGHRPLPPRQLRVMGRSGFATLRSALLHLRDAHQITDHDLTVATHLARVMSGGDVPEGAVVPEQHLLDLERAAFLSLCGEPKTQARIEHMLKTGEPLRN